MPLPLEQCVDVEFTIPPRGKAVLVRNHLVTHTGVVGAVGDAPSVLFERNEFAFRQGPVIPIGQLGVLLKPADLVHVVAGPSERVTIDVRRAGVLMAFRGEPRAVRLEESYPESEVRFLPPGTTTESGWMTLNVEGVPPKAVGTKPFANGRHIFQVLACHSRNAPGWFADVAMAINEPGWQRAAFELPVIPFPTW